MATYMTDKETGKLILKSEWEAKYGSNVRVQRNKNSALFGDRHYENLQCFGASNGQPTVINSRKQHRQFMADNNLTTIDDFSSKGGTWDRQEKARQDNLAGKDSTRRTDVVNAMKAHGEL